MKGQISLINCLEQRVSQELITMRRTVIGIKKMSRETKADNQKKCNDKNRVK